MTTKLKIVGAESRRQGGAKGGRIGKALKFSKTTELKAKRIINRYPAGKQQSAVMPLLKLAQDEFGGWLSIDAMKMVGEMLTMPYIKVYEVATFYTMFNLEPIGDNHVQVCTNCSCMIAGSQKIAEVVKGEIGVEASGETSEDGKFTFTEVECLGACVEAPMMQIGQHYYTKLTPTKTKKILKALREEQNSKQEPLVAGVTPTASMKDGY